MRSFAKNFNAYLRELTDEQAEVIKFIVKIVKEAVPDSSIVMKWGMPVFKNNNGEFFAAAAQRHYYSVYIWKFDWKKAFAAQIRKLNTGVECIRFTSLKKMPAELIKNLAKRSSEIE